MKNLFLTKTRWLVTIILLLTLGIGQVWGADATMTAGTNGSSASVSVGGVSHSAIKVGTSKAGGTMTITIPTNAKKLSLYAAAWNGVTGLSLNITPNTKVSPTSIALTANSGIANNSPFTFNGSADNYLSNIDLSSITTETTLTFTSSIAKRFVVWGAKYVFNPTSLTNTTVGSTTATLGWSYANSTDKYEVYYSTSNNAPTATTTPSIGSSTIGTTKSADLTGLTAGATYYWWVRAVDDYCKSAWVAGTSFTTASVSCDKIVNITKGTPETGGSFTLDKTGEQDCCSALTVTVSGITAPTGKRFSAITQTGIATGVTIDQNAKTVTYAANSNGSSTINVTFVDLPKYTVRLKDDDTELTQASYGASVTLPSRDGCSGYTFAGWTKTWTEEQDEWTTTAPTIINAGSYTPEGNENLYPVYTKTEGGGTTETTVTETFTNQTSHSSVTDWKQTLTWGASESNASIEWTTYYGKITSGYTEIRTYNDNVMGYLWTSEPITGLKKVKFKGWHVTDTDAANMVVSYSTDNDTWYELGTHAATSDNSTFSDEFEITSSDPSTAYYLSIDLSDATCPSSSNKKYRIDDIVITTETGGGSTTYYISVPNCCTELAAPANPGETPNSTGAVLTWDAVTGATGYEVKIDGGEWTSTGNGTTTGYTITGKDCGGTSVSWQVRATGDGSTNCAKGAATTARNFTTTACACTAYSFHYQHGSDWNTDNICFTAVTDATNNYLTDEMYLPYAEWYKVGWQGADQSYTVAKGFTGTTNNIPMPFYHNREKSFGANPQSGNIGGGKGRFHVYHDSGSTNKYVSFIPTGYTINFGTGDTWSNDLTLNFTGKTNAWDETEWYTEMTTLTDEQIGKKIFVGLQTALGYVWCDPYSQKDNLSGLRTKSGSGESWVSGGMTTAYPNKTGKFRIYADSGDKNWYVTFVPHYQLTYNANGGTGTMNPLPETPVSCEETSANRTITVGACTFTAPTGKEFKEWNTQADGNGTTIATGSRELTGDLKLYAIWKNESYSISATMTNVTSETSFPVAYTYTGSAANVTYTFAAASGYRLPDNVTVTGCTYTWDKTTGELTLTGTIEGAVSITISGTRTHTVSWTVGGSSTWTKAAGGTFTGQDPYDDGATLVVAPNPAVPSACDGKVFIGWTTNAEITEETSTQPSLLNTASPGTVTSDGVVYRAVFAEGSGELGKFKRVTSVSDITAGSQIAIAFLVSTDLKLCSLDFNEWTTYSCATTVTETSGKINTPANAGVWNVSKSGDYWVFTNAGDESTKLATSNSGSNQACDPSTQTYYRWEIGSNSSGTNHFYLRLYDGSAMTNCALELYQSTWKIYAPTSGGNYTYASNAYTALNLYVPDASYDKYITTCSTCTTPSGLATSNITSTGAKVTWNGVSSVAEVGGSGTGFTVLWGTDATRANNSNTANVAAGTNEYTLTGLTKATTYYVWVQSKCNDEWSSSTSFTTLDNHTATFIGADGSTLQSGNVDVGAAITYSGSTPVTCDDGDDPSNYFVGWATNTWSGKVAKASIVPTFYDIANGDYLPNMGGSDATFYAVFAKRSGTEPTDHVWTYTFTAQTYKANETKTLAGTEGGNSVNADWALLTYNQSSAAITNWGSYDSDRGSKIGKNDDDYVTYMYLSSESFDGTVTAVKISTSGNSGVSANVSAMVGGTSFLNNSSSSVNISNSNTEYSFIGSKAISGEDEIMFIWEQESTKALYIKKIEIDYTIGGDVTYSNYMTSCATCVTPTSVAASDITESGATVTWSGTSASGTEGFKVAWNTANSVPSPLTGSNSADVAKNVKTYDITGLNSGTTYYVFVQSKCNSEWSSSTNFTTLAVHTISFAADNGSISGGSVSSGSGTSSASAAIVNGQTLTFPTVSSESCGTFEGWVVGTYDSETTPSTLYKAGDEMVNVTAAASYNAVYRVASGAPSNVTDNLVPADFNATSTTYVATHNLTKTSSAVYEAVTAASYSSIQLNKISDGRGIVTPTSGGVFKSIALTTNSNHQANRKVYVYGNNSYTAAYADPAAFNTNSGVRGTLLATLEGSTKTYSTSTDDYEYIAIFADGAAYLDQIDITWYGSPMKYMTSPECGPLLSLASNFSQFSYVYSSGPSAAQSFTVSGIHLSTNLVVTAPTNYEVCKTLGGTYTSSVSYTPTNGTVDQQTVYIRLAAGLSVGDYDYAQATGLSVTSGTATARKAALDGLVTKATGAIAFTNFNAVDHYEAELEKGMSDIDVTLTVSVTGDGSVSYSKSPSTGVSPTIPATQPTTTLHVLQAGIWTVTATLAAGTNYNGANTTCEVRVKRVDTYVDFIHNKTIKEYSGGATVVDGKMNDWGSGYTVPKIDDNAEETSGSCQQTHFKFIGWVSEDDINIADGTFKSGYTIVTAGTTEKAATSKTYYAIWAKLEE